LTLTVVKIFDNNSKPALPWLKGSQNPAHFIKSDSVVAAFCNLVLLLAVMLSSRPKSWSRGTSRTKK